MYLHLYLSTFRSTCIVHKYIPKLEHVHVLVLKHFLKDLYFT